jgi:hypothetical protein
MVWFIQQLGDGRRLKNFFLVKPFQKLAWTVLSSFTIKKLELLINVFIGVKRLFTKKLVVLYI